MLLSPNASGSPLLFLCWSNSRNLEQGSKESAPELTQYSFKSLWLSLSKCCSQLGPSFLCRGKMKNKTNHQMPRCGDLELRHSKEVSQDAFKGSDFFPNLNYSSLESSCMGMYSNDARLTSEGHSLQPSVLSCRMSLGIDTHLGTGTRIIVPSTSGFRFMPLSLIAFAAAAVLCKTDQKVKGIRK